MSNHFRVISPTFNSADTCRQAIRSLFAQSYKDWSLVVIDDVSTDKTCKIIEDEFARFEASDRLIYIKNRIKEWEIANTLKGLAFADDEDIIVRLDLDDFLLDNSAFQILNQAYEGITDLEAAWTTHRWFGSQGFTMTNISDELPIGVDPYKYPWVSSHLKTWRKRVLNSVKDDNYRNNQGEYFKRIGDQAFFLPVLKLAKKSLFLPICAYAYRCDQNSETFLTEDAKFQAHEALELRKRGFIV